MIDQEIMAWFEKTVDFHTKRAPGLAIGVAMVGLCREKLGPVKEKLNAVSESPSCLCDVIQLMTGCTIGNRYLKVFGELGRFALTLYDRADGRGVRVSIDIDKISATETPELHKFFLRQRSSEVKAGGPERLKSGEQVVSEFMRVRHKIILTQNVFLEEYGKPSVKAAAQCKTCLESFLVSGSEAECAECRGELKYYRLSN